MDKDGYNGKMETETHPYQRLKKARTFLGLSLAKVGRMLDVSSQTFNNWERGITPITPKIALRIEKTLGIGQEYVLNGIEDKMLVQSEEIDENYRKDVKLSHALIRRDMISVPLLSPQIKNSEGGSLTEFLEESDYQLVFDLRWLDLNFPTHPIHVFLFRLDGNYMEPTIPQGEFVFVDAGSFGGRIEQGLWLLKLGDYIGVRRIQQVGVNLFQASCDNPTYPPIPIELNNNGDSFKLLGRIVGGHHKRY
jgi:transcriptional regulator with XRE-family HTH domain